MIFAISDPVAISIPLIIKSKNAIFSLLFFLKSWKKKNSSTRSRLSLQSKYLISHATFCNTTFFAYLIIDSVWRSIISDLFYKHDEDKYVLSFETVSFANEIKLGNLYRDRFHFDLFSYDTECLISKIFLSYNNNLE